MDRSPYVAGRLEAGIAVLVASFVLGLVGVVLFFVAGSKEGLAVYAWREAALAIAAAALALFVWSLNVALPSRRLLRAASHGALAVCAVAVVLFILHYPRHFNIPEVSGRTDYIALDVGIYALGMAVMLGAAAASVIAHYVRFTPAVPEPEARLRQYEVPDWVVERDVDEAQQRHGVSWGLGAEAPETIALPGLSANAEVAGTPGGRTIELDGGRTERSSRALLETRPVLAGHRTAPAEWADEPTDALRRLQEARRADPKAFRPRVGFWATLFRRRSPGMRNGATHVPSDAAAEGATVTMSPKTSPSAKKSARASPNAAKTPAKRSTKKGAKRSTKKAAKRTAKRSTKRAGAP